MKIFEFEQKLSKNFLRSQINNMQQIFFDPIALWLQFGDTMKMGQLFLKFDFF